MHFDGPIVLKVHVEADNLLRQKFYRQLQPKCFHQVHCNLINDFKIHVQMRQGIILYEYDFLWSTPLASHTTLKTDNYGLTIRVSLAYKLELENNDSPSWIQNQVNILKLVGNDITILQSLVYCQIQQTHLEFLN